MGSDRRLFGEVAFEKGYISSEQLYEALAIQAKAEAMRGVGVGAHRFVGRVPVGEASARRAGRTGGATLESPPSVRARAG